MDAGLGRELAPWSGVTAVGHRAVLLRRPTPSVGEEIPVRWEGSQEGPEGAGGHRGWAGDHPARGRGTSPMALSQAGGSPAAGAAEETRGEKKRAQQNLPGKGSRRGGGGCL